MDDEKVIGGNGDGAAPPQGVRLPIVAQAAMAPNGRLIVGLADNIDNPKLLCLAAAQAFIEYAATLEVQQASAASKIIKAPPGMRVPPDSIVRPGRG